MTRRPLAIGWIGQGDFGDEAMAYALRAWMRRRGLPGPTYYLRGTETIFRAEGEARPNALYRGDGGGWKQRLLDPFLLSRHDAALVGGGSIFHSPHSIAWKLRATERIRRHGGVVASVGVSVGPLADSAAKRLCAEYLKTNDLVVVRDAESARTVARLSPSTRLLASRDTALALPEADPAAWKRAIAGPREPRTAAVSFVRRDEGRALEENDIRFAASVVEGLLKDGWRVRLFTLYTARHYRDRELHDWLLQTCSQPDRVEHHAFSGGIYETIAALNGCGAILSMRLHGIVLAYALGIPFVSLGYHRKNRDFCETIGYPLSLAFESGAASPDALCEAMRRAAAESNPNASAEPFHDAAKRVGQGLDAVCDLLLSSRV